jgi:hypothetical protein
MKKVSWTAHEYVFYEKTSDWYWILGIVAVTVAVVAILIGNFLFAPVVLLGAFALALYGSRRPNIHHYEITEKGVVVETVLYPYSTLEAFWIETSSIPTKILIRSNKLLMPLIVIPVEGVTEEEIRDMLNQHLIEEELNEPFAQKILEHIGF